jgi:hypothetical protein
MLEAAFNFALLGLVACFGVFAFTDLYDLCRSARRMETPADIRRRMEESLAFLASARQMWEIEVDDHNTRVKEIQEDCPHENQSAFSGQYGCERNCADCGKILEAF